MIVSWNWLKEYVDLEMPLDELTDRLTMTGLNLEGVEQVGNDVAIDLEVTSNRPDCLGHIGVAREIAVLFDSTLRIPRANVSFISDETSAATSVDIECEDLCPRYIARVIKGVKVGPARDWLMRRLLTLGIASVNNVVDVTNYVLMESGQPLHAFDFTRLSGKRIIVRRAKPGETITAIDQREYKLEDGMCVIADADRPVAVAGVMGGLDTEISEGTVDVLIETAEFAPLSVRNTARKLNLHSDSSYRFERGVDSTNLDWASRRCCELIIDVAGGELLEGSVYAGAKPAETREPIRLRFGQIPRLLGIDVPSDEATAILKNLGLNQTGDADDGVASFTPPAWRRDLEREVDLIEEVARIHGYDRIPDDVAVPLTPSSRTTRERVESTVRDVFTSAGFYEAVTLSFITDEQASLFTPRGPRENLTVEHSSRRQENVLRQSLIPSLLGSRRENERQSVFNAELFEIARVYLQASPGGPEREVEPIIVGCVSGRTFSELKGVVESLVKKINRHAVLTARPADVQQFAPGRGAELLLNGEKCGWLGELDRSVTDKLDLRDAVSACEFEAGALVDVCELTPAFEPLQEFPAIERDLNFVLPEEAAWRSLEETIRGAAGPLVESVRFSGQYRGKQIDAGMKSYVATVVWRAADRTLTGEEVDASQQTVVSACEERLSARLR